MKPFVKASCLLLAGLTALSCLTACGKKDEGGKKADGPKRDSIIIATANETPSLAPYNHNATAANYMNGLTYSTLMRSNTETLGPEPHLAESVEALSELEWEIRLKKGVKFHDGTEMRAEDVKASMEWAKNDFSAYTAIYTNWWDDIEVKDDYTLRITTPSPCAKAKVNLTSIKIVPKALIESGNDFNANPVGTGPYTFVDWTLVDSLSFKAFPDYFEGAAPIENMTWRIIPEGSSRTIALEAGEVDCVIEVEANDRERLERADGVTLLNVTGTNHNEILLNTNRFPFNNQDFRHGLNCAVDKDAVAQVALNGAGGGIWNQTPSNFTGYTDRNEDKYDKALAEEYFKKSGVDLEGLSFSCICSDDQKRRAAEVIQANLAEFGINMTLESMDLATYLAAVSDGNFETAIGGYTTSTMMSFIEGRFLSADAGGNSKNFKDEQLDSMYLEAITILDDAARTKALEDCVARLNEVCPYVPLYIINQTRAYNSDLQNLAVSAAGTINWQYVSWAE